MQSGDLIFTLSGGSINSNPDESLGGDPSSYIIRDGVLNNLFRNVSSVEAASGNVDHRCAYLFNDGEEDVFYLRLFILNETEGGSDILLGINATNEIQRIRLHGNLSTSGSFVLSFEGKQVESFYNSDIETWSLNLQSDLRSLLSGTIEIFPDIEVTGAMNQSEIIFDVSFSGRNSNKNYSSFQIDFNNISQNSAILTIQEGSPVNTITGSISDANFEPNGVTFFYPTESNPLIIPRLFSGEGLPIWFKRTTDSSTIGLASDGFTLRIIADSFEKENVIILTEQNPDTDPCNKRCR